MTHSCVICLQSIKNDTSIVKKEFDVDEGESEDIELLKFFKLFERHLRLDNQTGLFNEERAVFNDAVKSAKLIACGDCSEVMRSFCEIYHRIKSLQLFLDGKVETLKVIMGRGFDDLEKIKAFRKNATRALAGEMQKIKESCHSKVHRNDPEEMIDMILNYKATLVEHCGLLLKDTFPKPLVRKEKTLTPKKTFRKRSPSTVKKNPKATRAKRKAGSYLIEAADEGRLQILSLNQDQDEDSSRNETFDDDPLGFSGDEPEQNTEPVSSNNEKESKRATLRKASTRPRRKRIVIVREGDPDFEPKKPRKESKKKVVTFAEGNQIDAESEGEYDVGSKLSEKETDGDPDFEPKKPRKESKKKVVTFAEGNQTDAESDGEYDEASNLSEKETTLIKITCPEPSCNSIWDDMYKLLLHRKKKHNQQKLDNTEGSEKEETDLITVSIFKFESHAMIAEFMEGKIDKSNVEIYAKVQVPPNLFQCSVANCSQLFSSQNHLDSHSQLHGEFKCNFCDEVEEYATDLARHELQHEPAEKSKPIKMHANCPRCDLSFSQKIQYLTHHVTKHLSLRMIEQRGCPICGLLTMMDPNRAGNSYRTIARPLMHFKRDHDLIGVDPETFQRCTVPGCFGYFKTHYALSHHCRKIHSDVFNKEQVKKVYKESFKCYDCDKTLSSRLMFRRHRLRYHVDLKDTLPCLVENCRQRFEEEEDLQSHMDNFHNTPKRYARPCPKCGDCFFSDDTLSKHLRGHERKEKIEAGLIPSKPERVVCELCGKSVKDKIVLKTHMKRHLGMDAWEFSCSICGKKCFDRDKLKNHERTHTGEKPFLCQFCPKAFTNKFNMNLHTKNKHQEELMKKLDLDPNMNTESKGAGDTLKPK